MHAQFAQIHFCVHVTLETRIVKTKGDHMDTQDYIRQRDTESRQFQRGVRIMSRATSIIASLVRAILAVIAIALVIVVSEIVYNFLYEIVFKSIEAVISRPD